MKLKKKHLFFLLFTVSIALFARLYNLEKIYSFGWDQERDAWVALNMIANHKFTLIGPRVVSETGFFLGPLWYYLLTPFYFIFKLDPISGAYFTAFFGAVTTAAIFIIFKKLSGINAATIASLAWAVFPDRVAWNPILVPLITLFVLYLISKIDKKYSIPAALTLVALGLQIHVQIIFLFIPIAIAIFLHYKKLSRLPYKQILLGVAGVALTFAPLVLFDLRHDFINSKTFLAFVTSSQNTDYETWTQFSVSSSYLRLYKTVHWLLPLDIDTPGFAVVFLSIIGFAISKLKKNFKYVAIASIVLPPIFFSFYRGLLSEYYFLVCSIPVLLGLSIFLGKLFDKSIIGKVVVFAWLALIFKTNLGYTLNEKNVTGLYYKKQAVKYLVEQDIDPVFNVSYQAGYSGDAGFRYLFKYYGREPEDTSEGHLWTIMIPAYGHEVDPSVTFGDIGIVRR